MQKDLNPMNSPQTPEGSPQTKDITTTTLIKDIQTSPFPQIIQRQFHLLEDYFQTLKYPQINQRQLRFQEDIQSRLLPHSIF